MQIFRVFSAAFLFLGICTVGFGQARNSTVSPIPPGSELSRAGLTRSWIGQARLNPKRDKLTDLVVDDERVYAQTSDNTITCFSSDLGKLLWSVHIGSTDEPFLPLAVEGENILAAVGMSLYALNKSDGSIRWTLELPYYPTAIPTVHNNNMYMGFMNGTLISINLAKVADLHAKNLLPSWSFQAVNWRYNASREISSPAIVNNDYVFFASHNSSLYCVTTAQRILRFQFETDDKISAPILRYNDTILIAGEDFRLYSVKIQTGELLWQFPSGVPIRRSPHIVGDDLFVAPDRGGMFNLSPVTGDRKWWNRTATEFLAVGGSRLYVKDTVGDLCVLSRETGGELHKIGMRPFTVFINNVRTDRIYLGTPSGLIMCLREKDSEFPKFHQFPDRQPLMPEFASENEPVAEPKPETEPETEPKEEM